MDGKRSFTVVKLLKPAQLTAKTHTAKKTTGHGGRFVSSTPVGAAKKAFNAACRGKNIRGQCTLVVYLQETTAGSDKKLYKYKLKRFKLDKPRIFTRGDVQIKSEYDVKAESMN